MPRVEMVQVYNVQVSTSNCTQEQMDAAQWPPAKPGRPYDRDQHWVYDDIEAAFARVRKALPTMPKEATVMLDLGVMSVAEYAALPADED